MPEHTMFGFLFLTDFILYGSFWVHPRLSKQHMVVAGDWGGRRNTLLTLCIKEVTNENLLCMAGTILHVGA